MSPGFPGKGNALSPGLREDEQRAVEGLISCVVPVFNGERFLAEALDSILGQSYTRTEIIVADDGSTDGTAAVLDRYAARVRVVGQLTAGPASTRNLGLRAATGEFVAFLDADDRWHPEKLALQMEVFRGKPELEACVTYAQMFWESSLAEEAEEFRDHPRTAPVPGFATTTLLARRAVFDRVGYFNTSLWFSDATDWFLRAREQCVLLEVVPKVLVFHRMHENNLTRRRSQASRQEFARIVHESLARRRSAAT
jgi:glycosyltransferase involved in cell wall biosynthesis